MSLPLFAATIGGVSFNMGGKISEQDYVRAILQGSKKAGIIGCTGDGVPEFIHKTALEYIPGSARVLSRLAGAVGSDICVLADGGVRSGGDILKMPALGADAVMIGHPFCVAALGGLKEGVKTFIEIIRSELIQAMVLTGTQRADQVDESILFKA